MSSIVQIPVKSNRKDVDELVSQLLGPSEAGPSTLPARSATPTALPTLTQGRSAGGVNSIGGSRPLTASAVGTAASGRLSRMSQRDGGEALPGRTQLAERYV